MTYADIIRQYKVSRDTAELIEEYLKEVKLDNDTMLPIVVNEFLQLIKNFRLRVGYDLTLEEARKCYQDLPPCYKEETGDNYLLGFIKFFMN